MKCFSKPYETIEPDICASYLLADNTITHV